MIRLHFKAFIVLMGMCALKMSNDLDYDEGLEDQQHIRALDAKEEWSKNIDDFASKVLLDVRRKESGSSGIFLENTNFSLFKNDINATGIPAITSGFQEAALKIPVKYLGFFIDSFGETVGGFLALKTNIFSIHEEVRKSAGFGFILPESVVAAANSNKFIDDASFSIIESEGFIGISFDDNCILYAGGFYSYGAGCIAQKQILDMTASVPLTTLLVATEQLSVGVTYAQAGIGMLINMSSITNYFGCKIFFAYCPSIFGHAEIERKFFALKPNVIISAPSGFVSTPVLASSKISYNSSGYTWGFSLRVLDSESLILFFDCAATFIGLNDMKHLFSKHMEYVGGSLQYSSKQEFVSLYAYGIPEALAKTGGLWSDVLAAASTAKQTIDSFLTSENDRALIIGGKLIKTSMRISVGYSC